MQKQSKVSIRTCCACRSTSDKRTLLRIVRTPEGKAVVDPSGKMAGRGTYICRTVECLRRAVKEKKLSRSLRMEVPEETVGQIEETIKQGSEKM